MATLTNKQRLFIEHYLQCWNGTEAARRAGYNGNDNTLAAIASENLTKRAIREHIDFRLAELSIKDKSLVPKQRKKNKACLVYLIKATNGLVKIGKTVNIAQRFNKLNTMSPLDLELIGVISSKCAAEIEDSLHAMFISKRVRGEWFDLNEEDIASIRDMYEFD